MSEALYRKYRPQVFDDVVGQDGIESTLKSAIETNRLTHAYLFTGPRGTGKTTTARLVAKALLCKHTGANNAEGEEGECAASSVSQELQTSGVSQGSYNAGIEPDGTCEDCQLVAAGTHPDVYELDAASRTGVENVRDEIISRVAYAPTRGRYKIYIIDEVHMLSTAAFNALLKTLEEPPSHVVFIMCTTDPQKVPDTIQSRCQRFDFKSISTEIIAARLSAVCELEQIEAEPAALEMIARAARGGMRDALTNLEQMSAFGRGKVDLALTKQLLGTTDSDRLSALLNAVAANDCGACFEQIDKLCSSGVDVGRFASDFATYIRNVYAASLGAADASPEAIDEAGKIGQERLAYMLDEISTTLSDLKSSINPRLIFEMYCVRVCRLKEAGSLAALSARIEALEQKLRQVCEGGVAVSGASAYAAPQVAEGAGANRAQVVAASAQPSAALQQPIAQRAVSEPATNVQPASAGNVLSRTNAGSAGGASTTAGSVGGAQSHKLADVWALVVSDMKSQSQQAGPLLDRARPRFSSVTNTFTIKFVKGDEFYFMAIQSATIVSMLNAALARAYGRQVNLTFEIVDPPANQNTAPAAAPATQSATSAAAPAASSSVAPTSAAESTSSASAAPVETTAAFEPIATFGVPVSSTPASGVVSNIQAGVASEQAPMPDAAQVPTSSGDSYDEPLGYAAYDYVPIEDFASASVDEPTSNASAATSASDSAVGASVASDTPDATSGATPDVAEVDWQNNLQEAFGGGIVFEEV